MNDIDNYLIDINENLKKIKNKARQEIQDARDNGYREGFAQGISKRNEIIDGYNIPIEDIDYNSIHQFANFCYIHGIDFSYMGKATDTEPFVDRVIKKFKQEIESPDCIWRR